MREAALILPVRDNAGRSVSAAHTQLSSLLVDSFGGYTQRHCEGAWRDDTGHVHKDSSSEYAVAADWNDAKRDKLERIARVVGRKARQLSVYVRHDDGTVNILPV